MMRRLNACLLVAFFTGVTCSANEEKLQHIQQSAQIMGTTFVIEIYAANRACAERAGARALDEARRLDRMLSDYVADSELSRVNANAASRPVQISLELFDLLRRCLRYSGQSKGAFDITVGPLMKVWGFHNASGRLPSRAEIQAAIHSVGYKKIKLDDSTGTVRFTARGVSLDPGGVGKGYAVDRMVALLKNDGIGRAFLSAGGSSIYGLGAPPGSPVGWPVHIQNPWYENKTSETVYLKDNSLSTSGAYEKFFSARGQIYSHIMDPHTGYPAKGVVSVSVVAPQTLDSEVWAKPYYIRGREWTLRHMATDFAVYLCEDAPGRTCSWVGK